MLLIVGLWAYTLNDQVEPDVLTLRTQQGSYRIERSDDWGCSYLLANQNVQISDGMVLIPESEGWAPTCTVRVISQVDDIPCSTNDWGDCDVKVENAAG